MAILLINALIVGFIISAPVGPTAILCVKRVLNKNFASGIATGLGAATSDLIYAFITAFGFSLIHNFLLNMQNILNLVGGAILILLGLQIILSKNKELKSIKSTNISNTDYIKDFSSVFIYTFINPITLLIFTSILPSLNILNQNQSIPYILLIILFIFIGSMVWWLLLCFLAVKLKTRLNGKLLTKINIISAMAIIFFGISVLGKGLGIF